MYIITIIGAIASIIGAGVSCRQASKAKGAAEEAKRVRAQLVDHRKISELTMIQASCKSALNSMKKYGPAFTIDSLAGVNTVKDAADVQEFTSILTEHRKYFGNKIPNKADEFSENLTCLLKNFTNSSKTSDHKTYGEQIFRILNFNLKCNKTQVAKPIAFNVR